MTKSDQITIEFINNPDADVNKLAKKYKTAPSYVYKMRARAQQQTANTLRDSEQDHAMDALVYASQELGGWQVTASTPTSTDVILEERGKRYGKFVGHAEISQALRTVIWDFAKDRECVLTADQGEALIMICHKIARIINGDPNYHDSWADIAGYAKLVADRLETGKEV
jgi:hypothetical protein